jgi:hypothetical protein
MIEDGVIIPGEPAAVPETPESHREVREDFVEQFITRRSGSYHCNVCGYAVANGHILVHGKIAGGADCPVGLLMALPAAPPDDIGAATMRYKALYERKARELAYLVTSGNPAALEKVVLLLARDDKQKSEESNGK